MANSSEVQVKTVGTNVSTVVSGTQSNPLNSYRSINYMFTLSALRKTQVNDPSKYRNSELTLVILKSGGKGSRGIDTNVTSITRTYTPPTRIVTTNSNGTVVSKPITGVSTATQTWQDTSGGKLVSGFNENSPGRFDMFIEDVEIETIMGFSENSSVSQPTKISFNVIEPYSISGFIEALQVSAIAAGYPTYQGASYLLKIDFIGYPDEGDFSKPEIVEGSSRYFPLKFTAVEVAVDEKGTKYRCEAVPFNEAGFGKPSELKKPVKIAGDTVRQILENLADGLNKQVIESDNEAKQTTLPAEQHDTYKVTFPSWSDIMGFAGQESNDIGKAKVIELLKDNAIYKFPDSGSTTKPNAYKAKDSAQPTPQQNAQRPESFKPTFLGQPIAQFPEGKQVHECIAAIIRDSQYVRNIAEKLSSTEWQKVVDNFGMVDYFMVKLDVTNKDVINPDTKRPYQIFNYVVTPHKVMYTRLPNYGNQQVDKKKLKKLSLREYNYIYTGKNIDILNFKLNFNTLFFEAIPAALGNSNTPPPKNAAVRSNSNSPKSTSDNMSQPDQALGLPLTPQQVDSRLTSVDKDNAGQSQSNAYAALAKGIHRAIIDSKASMIDGEIDILGDPYYLVTGGIGNYNPKPAAGNPRLTQDGEAAHNYGEVLININFRNPTDYDEGGRIYFEPELIPFSGIYRVNEVRSAFKDGVFKQTLKILRAPGQSEKASDPSKKVISIANKQDQTTQDTTPAEKTTVIDSDTGTAGNRASTLNLLGQLNRGLPSPGLPGELSNFTNATGGLGGDSGNLLNQVSGAVNNFNRNTRLATQLFGGLVPGGYNQSAQGIPLQPSGISAIQQQSLSQAALVTQAANTIGTAFGVQNPASQLASNIVSKANKVVNQVGILGSGIGVGKTISYNPNVDPSAVTPAGGTIPVGFVPGSMSSRVPAVLPSILSYRGLDPNAIAAVAGLSDNAKLVSKAAINTIAITQGTKADRLATAVQFGIEAAQLSGIISPNLSTKVLGQMVSLASNVPKNTNLAAARAAGLVLTALTPKGLSSLPSTSPYHTAPSATPDSSYLNALASSRGPSGVARAYGVNNINEVPQSQLSADSAQGALDASPPAFQNPFTANPLTPQFNISGLSGKYLTASAQLGEIAGIPLSVEANLDLINYKFGPSINGGRNLGVSVISKFGSYTAKASPLSKIMRR